MIFHLAIPSKDLDESIAFYKKLGAKVGRRYDTHVVLTFYDHQLVCHKSDKIDLDPKMYPRHFGIILDVRAQLDILWDSLKSSGFIYAEYFVRHENKHEEHHVFFLRDPSNNLIEFKWYKSRAAISG